MKPTHALACLLIAGTAFFSSCKKKDDTTPTQQAPSEQAQQTTDNSDVKTESDQVNSDATDVLDNFPSLKGGRVGEAEDTSTNKQICGCHIDGSRISEKIITLNFDGITPCLSPSRTRGGKIEIRLVRGDHWADQNAKLQITMTDYKVVRLSDNKSVTFNGVKTLTNVRGLRYLAFLAGTDSLVYKERGTDIHAVLDNGATHTYSVARTTYLRLVQIAGNSQFRFRATGDTTLNGVSSVDAWGTNRYNTAFTSTFIAPWVSNTYCGFWRPVSGQYEYASGGNRVDITLGLNQQGTPSTLDCAYGYKISWDLANGQSGEQIKSY